MILDIVLDMSSIAPDEHPEPIKKTKFLDINRLFMNSFNNFFCCSSYSFLYSKAASLNENVRSL